MPLLPISIELYNIVDSDKAEEYFEFTPKAYKTYKEDSLRDHFPELDTFSTPDDMGNFLRGALNLPNLISGKKLSPFRFYVQGKNHTGTKDRGFELVGFDPDQVEAFGQGFEELFKQIRSERNPVAEPSVEIDILQNGNLIQTYTHDFEFVKSRQQNFNNALSFLYNYFPADTKIIRRQQDDPTVIQNVGYRANRVYFHNFTPDILEVFEEAIKFFNEQSEKKRNTKKKNPVQEAYILIKEIGHDGVPFPDYHHELTDNFDQLEHTAGGVTYQYLTEFFHQYAGIEDEMIARPNNAYMILKPNHHSLEIIPIGFTDYQLKALKQAFELAKDYWEHLAADRGYYKKKNPDIKLENGKVLADGQPINQISPEVLHENIVLYHNKDKGNFFAPAGWFFLNLVDTNEHAHEVANAKEGKSNRPIVFFPGTLARAPNFPAIWKKKMYHPGIIGAVQGQLIDGVLNIEYMSVRPKFRRNKVNTAMIDFLKDQMKPIKVVYHDLTKEGEAFHKSRVGEKAKKNPLGDNHLKIFLRTNKDMHPSKPKNVWRPSYDHEGEKDVHYKTPENFEKLAWETIVQYGPYDSYENGVLLNTPEEIREAIYQYKIDVSALTPENLLIFEQQYKKYSDANPLKKVKKNPLHPQKLIIERRYYIMQGMRVPDSQWKNASTQLPVEAYEDDYLFEKELKTLIEDLGTKWVQEDDLWYVAGPINVHGDSMLYRIRGDDLHPQLQTIFLKYMDKVLKFSEGVWKKKNPVQPEELKAYVQLVAKTDGSEVEDGAFYIYNPRLIGDLSAITNFQFEMSLRGIVFELEMVNGVEKDGKAFGKEIKEDSGKITRFMIDASGLHPEKYKIFLKVLNEYQELQKRYAKNPVEEATIVLNWADNYDETRLLYNDRKDQHGDIMPVGSAYVYYLIRNKLDLADGFVLKKKSPTEYMVTGRHQYGDTRGHIAYITLHGYDPAQIIEFEQAWDRLILDLKNAGMYVEPIVSKNPRAIPGGLSEGMSPADFNQKSLRRGTKVEMEHTTDPKIAQEIAMDHLVEDPKYYSKLARMEKNPTSDWGLIETEFQPNPVQEPEVKLYSRMRREFGGPRQGNWEIAEQIPISKETVETFQDHLWKFVQGYWPADYHTRRTHLDSGVLLIENFAMDDFTNDFKIVLEGADPEFIVAFDKFAQNQMKLTPVSLQDQNWVDKKKNPKYGGSGAKGKERYKHYLKNYPGANDAQLACFDRVYDVLKKITMFGEVEIVVSPSPGEAGNVYISLEAAADASVGLGREDLLGIVFYPDGTGRVDKLDDYPNYLDFLSTAAEDPKEYYDFIHLVDIELPKLLTLPKKKTILRKSRGK